jgi:hypothetical protein
LKAFLCLRVNLKKTKEGKSYRVVLLQKIDSLKKEMLKVLSPVIKVIKKLETKN